MTGPVHTSGLPSDRQLRLLVLRIDSIVGFPALAVVVLYLAALVDFHPGELAYFALAAGIFTVACSVGLEPLRRRMRAPLLRLIHHTGDAPDDQLWRDAFACSMRLPQQMMRLTFVTWLVAGPLMSCLMWAFGFDVWFSSERLFGVGTASLAGALLTVAFGYLVARRHLAPLCERIAREIPDAQQRRELIQLVPLRRKLQLVVAGSSLGVLIFTMVVAFDGARRAVVDVAGEQQERVLATFAEGDERDWNGKESAATPDLAQSSAIDGMIVSVHESVALPVEWERLALSETGTQVVGESLVSWRWLAGDRVAAVQSPTGPLFESLGMLRGLLATVLALASALCLGLAWMFSEDVVGRVARIRHEADQIASGDLRSGSLSVSDDELADLASAFWRMGEGLRTTLGRLASAASRFDAAVHDIQGVSAEVSGASAEQARRVGEVGSLVEGIAEETRGVSGLAGSLSESVEESSSSILELGATGDELSDTAGVLSTRIEEVSTSIEQMVRSVKLVGVTTQTVSEAASDTSSSMEEMASAMRAIDTTAAKTAGLASDVVESSESGLVKVRETIDGMQSIRDATDDAERVIRGLGERTKEIGAILDVIDDVGDETTLLALNAAIIAAQAGEQGRAFSVVADEIKELADRVLSSTKEIGGLIRSVQGEAANAVGAIEAGSQRVAEGVDLAAEAGVSLEGITRAAAESGQHIARIVEAVREQTGAASHVAQLMDSVSSGVDEIRSASADQDRANEFVYRSAMTMSELAQQVRRTTEEQSRGFSRIRESVEAVRETVTRIDGSVREQDTACQQVRGFLDIVDGSAHSNEQAVERMQRSLESLSQEAEALRDEVGRFEV